MCIRDRQGFNGPPTVVSREEFDRAVGAGEVRESFRGVYGPPGHPELAAHYAEQFRSGDHYPGTGIYGNGTYVSMHRENAAHGEVLRVGLRRDAKVISHDELVAQMHAHSAADAAKTGRIGRIADLDHRMMSEAMHVPDDDTAGRVAVYAKYNTLKDHAASVEYRVSSDAGRFAALRGYDAIDVPNGQ